MDCIGLAMVAGVQGCSVTEEAHQNRLGKQVEARNHMINFCTGTSPIIMTRGCELRRRITGTRKVSVHSLTDLNKHAKIIKPTDRYVFSELGL